MSGTAPLILITNDDGYAAKGINALIEVAREMGDVIVMAPEANASAKSHSLTTTMPLRVRQMWSEDERQRDGQLLHSVTVYACNGTPTDCAKLGTEHFSPRRPDLVLSGINHGSNASINVIYSGTMGAALEAVTNGYASIGFSLLDHHYDADFTPCLPYVRQLMQYALVKGLPDGVGLNVNFPETRLAPYKGVKVCRSARASWTDSFERRTDPHGHPYWWLTGKFVCNDNGPDTDQWALEHGYVSVVPVRPDYTDLPSVNLLKPLEQ